MVSSFNCVENKSESRQRKTTGDNRGQFSQTDLGGVVESSQLTTPSGP